MSSTPKRRKAFIFGLMILVPVVALSGVARAEIYRYLDSDGAWRFSNQRLNKNYHRWLVGHEKFFVDDEATEVLGSGPYDDVFVEAGKMVNLAPALLKAVAAQESGFNPRAISDKGALGLMQLMPKTAHDLEVDDPFNPEQSIRGGARYLRMLVDDFSGNIRLAVAAYNCGSGPVRKVLDVPMIDETQDYVHRVFKFYSAFSGQSLEPIVNNPEK